jgi:replicative superfamily II helicase
MESAAHLLQENVKNGKSYVRDAGHEERLRSAAQHLKNKALQAAIVAGIGFHNAAMENEERAMVEQLFLAHDILVRQRSARHRMSAAGT